MVFRDETQRRQMQLTMERADRLISIGTMASGVAHEINDPLAFMIMNLTFLAEELKTRKARTFRSASS